MNFLKWLSAVAIGACLGAIVAAFYGILHDQITYTLSEEYFTKFKFIQFARFEEVAPHPRMFVGLIGVLATWWVGLFAGLILGALIPRSLSFPLKRQFLLRGFAIVMGIAFLAAVSGGLMATLGYYDLPFWERVGANRGIENLPAFVRVGFIHNASYLGGAIGLLLAAVYLPLAYRRRAE